MANNAAGAACILLQGPCEVVAHLTALERNIDRCRRIQTGRKGRQWPCSRRLKQVPPPLLGRSVKDESLLCSYVMCAVMPRNSGFFLDNAELSGSKLSLARSQSGPSPM